MQFIAPGDDFNKRHGANLPHWTYPGATYFVTFRLADSLPAGVLEDLIRERDEFLAIVRAKRDEKTANEVEREYQRKLHGMLDKGAWQVMDETPRSGRLRGQCARAL